MSNFSNDSNNIANQEVSAIAKKFLYETITELKHSTKATDFEGTNLYINNPGRVFSVKNFTLDKIQCAVFSRNKMLIPGNMRCCDLFITCKCNESKIIRFDGDKLLIYNPDYCPDEQPSVIFSCNQGDDLEPLSEIEIYGDVLIFAFDWKNNSFKDLTEEDLESIRERIY